ncbi:hypothetical protein PR202_gb18060 [Eleusine coracana subsp. coracana]|uniref:DUF3615 domain-containing protein n=1 Tax=Eleusine coracana subsp. coracana TaxID=191504 RepID=A0AAV5F653_ELECO|nr:hypothetical protein PR202_gb17993 [Eleusine coracana subsp. coracana]GJN29805.1 hypothetical protein PR202_gb18060 [Eleusine coracana subsp. coracana]
MSKSRASCTLEHATASSRVPPGHATAPLLVAAATESITSAVSLHEPGVSSSEDLLSPPTEPRDAVDGSPPSGRHCYSASSGPAIWVRRPPDWHFVFCIRKDREGSFHIYPDLIGGPFQSLQAAEDAIDRYVNGLPRPARCNEQDGVLSTESQIRRIVFYPDGTPKRGPNSPGWKNPHYRQHRLVRVILDQYNYDHDLFGDRAHELYGEVKFNWFDEDDRSYYHFNFMTKTKDSGDVHRGTGNLFFAELSEMQQAVIQWSAVVASLILSVLEDTQVAKLWIKFKPRPKQQTERRVATPPETQLPAPPVASSRPHLPDRRRTSLRPCLPSRRRPRTPLQRTPLCPCLPCPLLRRNPTSPAASPHPQSACAWSSSSATGRTSSFASASS